MNAFSGHLGLLTWAPNGPAEFSQWAPWAVLFTLIRPGHDLTASHALATYSADLRATK